MAEVNQILCPICHKQNLRRARFCQHCGSDIVLNNDKPTDGRRYVITRVIKQGGQGAVYEGIDESGQVFAIKEMLDKFTDPKERTEAIERFNAEAELLKGMSHPRIPRIYSHFTDEGRHYLTMDFIRGKDLEQIAEDRGLLPEDQVLAYADQICDVLVYLHGKNLIYRDMKPSNVMIEDASGGVKLVDFGITKLFKPTERGTQIGTPGYAPPEQYQGLATPASDIYALGATLHHLLTGRDPTEQMPFDFPPANSVNSSVSKRTSEALQRALQKVPQDRFATMTEFWDALRPERARRPAQVRVAQPTVTLPAAAAAQVSGAPAMAGAAAPAAKPAPARPTPPPQPTPQRPPVPTPSPQQPARRRRGLLAGIAAFVSWMIALLVVATIGLGAYVYVARPAWAEPYLAPLTNLVPTSAPTNLTSQLVQITVTIQVPAGSSNQEITNALRAAFATTAKAQYGEGTLVNPNSPPSPISGTIEQLGDPDASGMATYQATMQGYIYTP
ncbi:protein kinase [Oscillochloris sp. ZM17-4]|uniref:serine/threonine-protein kinase n=1 Tax=Oscillochloris sp. ZM17-4 TaxID=2866714 RepID=UPI001C730DA3|nr:serine/threonine-protein kinase [Oscillochloris sp. ZM17-4]MBX0328102.1 protein kinase [Oscillochloris sp. ZM17-4]